MDSLEVWVDENMCIGCGLCELLAPDVFHVGSTQVGSVRGRAMGSTGVSLGGPSRWPRFEVAGRYTHDVTVAAESCPGECIYSSLDAPNDPQPALGD
jgi:ferredoxin